LYNRLASHAKLDGRNRSTNASELGISESKISKYENTNDIIKSARNHLSKEKSGRTRVFSTIDANVFVNKTSIPQHKRAL